MRKGDELYSAHPLLRLSAGHPGSLQRTGVALGMAAVRSLDFQNGRSGWPGIQAALPLQRPDSYYSVCLCKGGAKLRYRRYQQVFCLTL